MPRHDDLTGQRFGRLLVEHQAESRGGNRRWLCVCDCGTRKDVATKKLRNGSTISCGCFRAEIGVRRARDNCGVCGAPRRPNAPCIPCSRAAKAAYVARKRAEPGYKRPQQKARAPDKRPPGGRPKRGTPESKARSAENARRLKREYKQRNRHKAIADCAARFAASLRARPAWADRRLIDDLYALARIYRDAGFAAHVDHIVPLRSKIVCGLHVEANLTVLPAKANMLKSNRHWPDMPQPFA